jgi:hypothetical protein
VTLQNGVPGFIADTSVSPFVIGHIPVVGGRPAIPYSSFVAPPGGFGLYGTPSIPPMPAAQPGNWRVQQALQQRNQLRNDNRLAAGNAPGGNRPVVAANPPDDGDRAARPDPHPLPDPAVADAVSSAARPAPSLAEARRMHQQAGGQDDDEARRYFERGVTAEQSGKLSVARIYWKMALRRADGPLRERIQARLAALPD